MFSIIFGAFLKLIILETAKADIPGCHFLETVNITSSQRFTNGSFMYQEIEVPVNLTGQYDYITTWRNFNESTERHLRGCVCQLKPCIWICCRFKDWDESNRICNDGLMEELSEIEPFLRVTHINGSVVERNILKDFILLRDRMRFSDDWKEDIYTLFENGSVLFNSSNTITFRGYDCLHPNQFTSGNKESFVAAFHGNYYYEKPEILLQSEIKLVWLSEVFLVLTVAVYLYVRKLRHLHGKCFICYMITTFMYFIHQLLLTDQLLFQLCTLQGYLMYFFLISKFSWLLALSHQLWRGFTSVNRAESEYSFGAYSSFAWGMAAILTGVLFLIDRIWDGDPNKLQWVPGIGWELCYIKVGCCSFKIYQILVMVISIILNTTLFILTTISIIRIKLSLRHFSDQDVRAKMLTSRMQTYNVLVRLVFLMDIQWSLRVIYLIDYWDFLLMICRYCDSCIGITIFVLFVMKRSTLKLLMERIRNRSD